MQLFYFSILVISLGGVKCVEDVSVVVIGAGASGVAAATKLLENDITDIVVLEAESRIGGRIYSIQYDDVFIDLGALFCLGEEGNVVYNLSKQYNLLESGDFHEVCYHSSIGKVDNDLLQLMESLFFDCYDYDETKMEEYRNETLGKYCSGKIMMDLKELHETDKNRLKIMKSIPNFIERTLSAIDGAFDWNNIVLIDDWEYCEGDQYLQFNGSGYKTILEIMMKKYPDPNNELPFEEKLRLNSEVSRITWKDSKVLVECSDGTHYLADHVIFTPSVGVLKHNHQHMFNPQLPKEKVEVVENLGFGAIMIVAFHFPSRWWKEDEKFGLMWDKDDVKKLAMEFPKGPIKGYKHWLEEIFWFSPVPGNPNILKGWIGGKMVPEIEKLSDEILMEGAYFILKKFFEKTHDVIKPDKVFRMNWYGNQHFHGTFSYETPESRLNNLSPQMVLSKPLMNNDEKPLVLFAGEATHLFYHGTVHGAIESGYREAQRLINYLQ